MCSTESGLRSLTTVPVVSSEDEDLLVRADPRCGIVLGENLWSIEQ